MPAEPRLDIEAILRTLADHSVEYIVVGGVCAVLHGAPLTTFDLDVVHSRSPQNVRRLLKALNALEACYRIGSGKQRAKPGESHLSSGGHQLLMTRFGPLDVLGLIGKERDYTDLLAHSVEMRIGKGLTIRVLDLDTLIRVKQETAGEKDLAVLAVLRRLLEEKTRS